MIDEYQDTFPMVVEIMLSYLKQSGKNVSLVSSVMPCNVFTIKVLVT